jgi:hypothetical protein
MSSTVMNSKENSVLNFEANEFREKFPDHGFKVRHQLCERPELTLTKLAELAQRLPENLVEYYSGKVDVAQRSAAYPKTGLSVVETVRRIEECGSWMVMKNVEVDSEYNQIMRALLDQWYAQIDSRQLKILEGSMHREHAFIFVSSPNSVTPYHLDDEHNILLQIRGSKQVNMWDPKDRVAVPEPAIEEQLQLWREPDHERYLPYQEEFQKSASVFDLTPGEGLHFPYAAPHWVKNGPEVSISFSITFRSELSERLARIYFVNRRIRRLGISPVPPLRSPWRDSLKDRAFQAARRASRILKQSRGIHHRDASKDLSS